MYKDGLVLVLHQRRMKFKMDKIKDYMKKDFIARVGHYIYVLMLLSQFLSLVFHFIIILLQRIGLKKTKTKEKLTGE